MPTRLARTEHGAGAGDVGWVWDVPGSAGRGNVLISPKHQPFAAAATFDILSRIPTQTAPVPAPPPAATGCATRSCHAARKNKLDFRPSKTPSVFAAARCLTNVFFDFPRPARISLPPSRPGKKTCSLHFDFLSYFCEIVF